MKFKFYTSVNNKVTALDLNNPSTIYRAVFQTANGKIKIDNLNDQSKENPSAGEIVFNVPTETSEQILESDDRNFYITAVAEDGTETLMYNGEWRKPSEQSDVEDAIASARESAEARNQTRTKITEIDEKYRALERRELQSKPGLVKNAMNIPGFVNKKPSKSVPTVNRFGMKSPNKIRTNRSNTKGI